MIYKNTPDPTNAGPGMPEEINTVKKDRVAGDDTTDNPDA